MSIVLFGDLNVCISYEKIEEMVGRHKVSG